MGKRLLPRWHGWRTIRRKRKRNGMSFDYILRDKYHPYVADPGDSENPGLLLDGTVVMHPVFVHGQDLSGNPDPFGFKNMSDDQFYSMYEGWQEPKAVQDLHQWRWYRDNPESDWEKMIRIGQNEGLQIVSPEFDLLTFGMAGRDLWKGIKTFRALKEVPMSYTGVPREKVPFFRRFKGKIYTTDDVNLAEQYATGNFGRGNNPGGKVFKIYDMENGKDIVKIPEPEINPQAPNAEYAHHWSMIPYEIDENGVVKKMATNPGNVDIWVPNEYLKKPYRHFTSPVSNKAGIYRMSYSGNTTDNLAAMADYVGKRGVEIPSVVDGVYAAEDELGNVVMKHPAFTERIYIGDKPGLIKAPIDEPEWLTAWRNTRNMGSSLTGPGINLVFSNNGQ